jgi:hypothetical protein
MCKAPVLIRIKKYGNGHFGKQFAHSNNAVFYQRYWFCNVCWKKLTNFKNGAEKKHGKT